MMWGENFMNKNYKQGMIDASKPFEEKFNLQEDKIKQQVNKIEQNIDNLKEVSEIIMDDLDSYQKKQLFDLNTQFDIINLAEYEKEFLLASLYTLSNDISNLSEEQQKYILSVKNYLNIVNPQTNIDINNIENIKDTDSQRAILQVILEFLFLKNEIHEYTEKQMDFLDKFDLNNNRKQSIRDNIDNIYRATGAKGISEKYGYVVSQTLYEIEDNNDNMINQYYEEEIFFVDEFLDKPILIRPGEVKEYYRKNIYLNSDVNCSGTISFKECNIYYGQSKYENQIILDNGSSLIINNCKIICKDMPTNKPLFYNNNRYFDSQMNLIDISYSEFNRCGLFIDFYNSNETLIDNCKFINCTPYLIRGGLNDKKFEISNCIIIENDYTDYQINYLRDNDIKGAIIDIQFSSYSTPTIKPVVHNCLFIMSNVFKKSIKNIKISGYEPDYINCLEISDAEINKCTFINASNCISYANVISDCLFYRCDRVIYSMKKKGIIENCIFKGCYFELISMSDVEIKKCKFLNSKSFIYHFRNTINYGNVNFNHCEFTNINIEGLSDYNKDDALLSFGSNTKSKPNRISNCIFEGINLGGVYIASCLNFEKTKDYILIIENTIFENCFTQRKDEKIINEHSYYYGLFDKRVDFRAVKIVDCKGLDKINSGDSRIVDYPFEIINSDGTFIGSKIFVDILPFTNIEEPSTIIDKLI